MRVQNEEGMNGVATNIDTTAMVPKPRRTLPPSRISASSITPSPSAPPRDFVKTTVASINATMPAATRRRHAGCWREIAMIAATGIQVTMFIARSFGLPNIPLTAPRSRPFSTMLMPRA